MKPETGFKLFAGGIVISIVTSLAVSVALIWAAVHFIAKFW